MNFHILFYVYYKDSISIIKCFIAYSFDRKDIDKIYTNSLGINDMLQRNVFKKNI